MSEMRQAFLTTEKRLDFVIRAMGNQRRVLMGEQQSDLCLKERILVTVWQRECREAQS